MNAARSCVSTSQAVARSQKNFCLPGLFEGDKCWWPQRLLQQCHLHFGTWLWLLMQNNMDAIPVLPLLCQLCSCTETSKALKTFLSWRFGFYLTIWNVCIRSDCEQDATAIKKLSGALNAEGHADDSLKLCQNTRHLLKDVSCQSFCVVGNNGPGILSCSTSPGNGGLEKCCKPCFPSEWWQLLLSSRQQKEQGRVLAWEQLMPRPSCCALGSPRAIKLCEAISIAVPCSQSLWQKVTAF